MERMLLLLTLIGETINTIPLPLEIQDGMSGKLMIPMYPHLGYGCVLLVVSLINFQYAPFVSTLKNAPTVSNEVISPGTRN